MPEQPIGLIGVGTIGAALAERLLAAGYPVVGFDTDPARSAALVALGGTAAVSVNDTATRAQRTIIALVDPAITQDVIEAIAPQLENGHLIIDVSTGDPQRSEMLARRLLARGVQFVDAPLSGTAEQIRRGEAIAMLGGGDAAIAMCADLLSVIAAQHVHLGPPGNGHRAKLATNVILGLNRAALAEGLAFAETLGLDPSAFVELIRISPAYSRVVDAEARKMLEHDYAPESRILQQRREVALVQAAAGLPLPLSTALAALLDAAIAAGDDQLDSAAIIEVWRRKLKSSNRNPGS